MTQQAKVKAAIANVRMFGESIAHHAPLSKLKGDIALTCQAADEQSKVAALPELSEPPAANAICYGCSYELPYSKTEPTLHIRLGTGQKLPCTRLASEPEAKGDLK